MKGRIQDQSNLHATESRSAFDASQKPVPVHRVVENRYRSSRYFLEDQLRYSEAVTDFRSVRDFINGTPQFSLRNAFAFATETIQP